MKWPKLKTSAQMLSLIILSSSCASLALPSVLPLKDRTLRISRDGPWLEYQYAVCKKKILGICVSSEMTKDKYDLTNAMQREDLIDMGFVVKVREPIN